MSVASAARRIAPAWALRKTSLREVNSASDLLQSLCFRLDTAGDVPNAKVTLTIPAGTFEFP